MSGDRMGINKYDTETGEVKELCSHIYKKHSTNGFSNLNYYNGNLYCTFDQSMGTDCREAYIYKVNTKNGKMTKLCTGYEPILINKKIYYISYIGKGEEQKITGVSRCDLNGKNTKCIYKSDCVFHISYQNDKLYVADYNASSDYWVQMNLDGKKVSTSKRKQEISEDFSVTDNGVTYKFTKKGLIATDNTTKKSITLIKNNTKTYCYIMEFQICGDYILVRGHFGKKKTIKKNTNKRTIQLFYIQDIYDLFVTRIVYNINENDDHL